MSLINEALKKARLEAAQQEAAARAEAGGPLGSLPMSPFAPPERRRTSTWTIAGVAIFVAAAIGIGVGAWVTRPTPEATAVARDPAAPEPALSEVAANPEASEPLAASAAGAPSVLETTAPPPASAGPAAPPPPAVESALDVPPADVLAAEPSLPAAPPPAPPPVATPATSSAPAAPSDETVYVGVADLPGTDLELGFIVLSSAPFAQVNGRMVEVGERVGTYTLAQVERERVRFEGEDGTSFWIRVR